MPEKSPWNSADTVLDAFDRLIQRHRDSIVVISYRDDGIPSKSQLVEVLSGYKNQVTEALQAKQYALAHGKSHELLLIGR